MLIKTRLRFKNDIPWTMERKLIVEGGFRVFSRNHQDNWMILEKELTAPLKESPHGFDVLVNGELDKPIQDKLRKQLNSIVSLYEFPEKNETAIRARINNVKMTLPKYQKKFVELWVQNNIDAEDFFGVG